jgi:hypothetical protein
MGETASAFDAFRQVAAGFCRWCEGESLGPHPQRQASVWLSRLHAAALELPETEPENEEGLPELPHADLARAQGNLAVFAGVFYRTVFDPDPRNTDEPVIGDIGDDLLDTYKDIKAGSVLCDRGQPQEALWHWSFLHQVHWGRHAVGALAALQAAMHSSE